MTIEKLKQKIPSSIFQDFIYHFNKTDWGYSIRLMEKRGLAFSRVYWYNDDNTTVYLDSLSVNESIRKQLIGTRMQEVREMIGIMIGATSSCLSVSINSWMHSWYKRRGYYDLCPDETGKYVWMKKQLQ